MTARERKGSKNPLFPLTIAIVGLAPLKKVWVNYLPLPDNKFIIQVNGYDYYTLVKEDIDFEPSKVEVFKCKSLLLNDVEAHKGSMPWILHDVELKIN